MNYYYYPVLLAHVVSSSKFSAKHDMNYVFPRHFQATDSKKFFEIWLMNEKQVKELVNYVLEEDRIIHQQQLGLSWKRPQL